MDSKIPFRVFWHKDGFKECSLKLAKPNNPIWDKTLVPNKEYPDVCTMTVNAQNQHALYIMHNLNHKNVMCMRALGRSNSDENNELSAIILKCNGNLHKEDLWTVFALPNGFVPSPTFQSIIREIFDGVDFLWRNRTYHGNLRWETTYFEHPYTVKLYGFTPKEMPLEEAQWQDWDSIILMLEVAVARAAKYNAHPDEPKLVYDELEGLIDTMKASARVQQPLAMKSDIFDEVFFWNTKERMKFCMITISEFFDNAKFTEEVENSSICPKRWYCNTKEEDLTDFEILVKHCNDFRQDLDPPLPIFNENLRMGFVRLLHAAYTHHSQIMNEQGLNVDNIIRPEFPRLFVELNNIVKVIVNQGLKTPFDELWQQVEGILSARFPSYIFLFGVNTDDMC